MPPHHSTCTSTHASCYIWHPSTIRDVPRGRIHTIALAYYQMLMLVWEYLILAQQHYQWTPHYSSFCPPFLTTLYSVSLISHFHQFFTRSKLCCTPPMHALNFIILKIGLKIGLTTSSHCTKLVSSSL